MEHPIKTNPQKELYVTEKVKTVEIGLTLLQKDRRATDFIPTKWFKIPKIRNLAYQKEVMKCVGKKYNKDHKKFFVFEKVLTKWEKNKFGGSKYYPTSFEKVISVFDDFSGFKDYLNGDLSGAKLDGADFSNIDLTGCNIENTDIPTSALVEQGLDGFDIYDNLISYDFPKSLANENELIPSESIIHLSDINEQSTSKQSKYYYISDLHLIHKMLRLNKRMTDVDIRRFIRNKIIEMINGCSPYYDLFILGDVSPIFQINKIFYEELSKRWPSEHIIAVLGNHELWGYGLNVTTVDSIIEAYREMLDELDITLLENSLIVGNMIAFEEQLLEIDVEELRDFCIKKEKVIFGGIGFSGYNDEFNAEDGIYRNTLDRKEELKRTLRFEKIYKKIRDALGTKKIIIATHMQKKDWSKDDYCDKWIYVSGHTHRNEYHEDLEYTLYADNQIGYSQQIFGLKHFYLSDVIDIFSYYKDGIYQISGEEYRNFYRGIKSNVSFNRKNGFISMLKRNNFYMFIFKYFDKEKLYLLDGGSVLSLTKLDINYYYNQMSIYGDYINKSIEQYCIILNEISKEIKSIGGNGTVHGCIIDVDFYSHIYVNPFDGNITPYYAENIVNKKVYGNIFALIEEHCPKIQQKLLSIDKNTLICLNESSKEKSDYVPVTSIYSISRIMKKLQYNRNVNVIRTWSDEMLFSLKKVKNQQGIIE